MKTKRFISFLLLLVMTLSVFALPGMTSFAADETVTISISGQYNQSEARKMLSMINSFRTGSDAWYLAENGKDKITVTGLKTLVYDYQLERIAMQRAAEIALVTGHTRPNGEMCYSVPGYYPANYSAAGENIAGGYNMMYTAESAFISWREDDEDYSGQGHRRNMLYSNFSAVGIACFRYNGVNYWVQEFGNPVADTTETPPVNSTRNVAIEILKAHFKSFSISLSSASVSVQANSSAQLPDVNISFNIPDSWPFPDGIGTVAAEWEIEDQSVAIISGNSIKGLKIGSTVAVASVMGSTVRLTVNVVCNHTFEETVVKEPSHSERGILHRHCTKCGYEFDEQIPKLSYYPDVNDTQWFFECVDYCTEKGYVTGYTNGNFGPANVLQRQDFVLILARISGADLSEYENRTGGLTDVKAGKYYSAAVAWAVDKGIIKGYTDGRFGVGDSITREQVCTIIYRYKDSPDVTDAAELLSKYSDNTKVSDFAYQAVAWSVENGIIKGKTDTTIVPTGSASRADITMIIMRMDKAGMFA